MLRIAYCRCLDTICAVTGSSRRIYHYWLLLLLPTLAVGAGAIQLLRREQARLREQAAVVDAARRAAVDGRARLVAENVELLVGDVENGLLDALADAPAAGLDVFLDQWQRTNPLVRTTFRCTADGRILRPGIAGGDEEARGFSRRFAALFRDSPPWRSEEARGATPPPNVSSDALLFANNLPASPSREMEMEATRPVLRTGGASAPPANSVDQLARAQQAKERQGDLEGHASEARQQIASNVSQVQRARRDAQMLSKVGSYAPRAEAAAQKDEVATPLKEARRPGRRGWLSWTGDGRLHLLGWLQPGGAGEVRGVELELTALVSRMGGTLPAAVAAGEGYVLRDDKGRALHQAGEVPPNDQAAARVPLAAELLPGWEVAAFVEGATSSERISVSGGLFLVGSLLVGIFVVASLAGGLLLLRQAQRSGEEARQKTSFVANVSHEFKTPLTTIRLYSELLEQGRVPSEERRGEYLRTIGRETQRLARLVNNALDFSRLEQGRKKFQREPLDLGAELARLLDTQLPRFAEAGLTLRRELPDSPLSATTDRDALEQIVLNLLDNACKYAGAGGEVTVQLMPRAGGGVELRVLDRGPGVPAEHRERIFEKFHRVDDTLTAEKRGAGLGLSIARQLARGLGGELRYEPRAGGGAIFILELP
jgi:two-component system, OmpR family, phosphate regulon sensor histidine kinase PhoR